MSSPSYTTPTHQSELFRHVILLQLASASPRSLPVDTLKQGAHLAGFEELSKHSLHKDLAYLVDKGLLSEEPSFLSPANKRYRINAKGQDYLSTHNLI